MRFENESQSVLPKKGIPTVNYSLIFGGDE
jgi:hypothetical protein